MNRTDFPSDSPRVLKCRSTADFLAALPHFIGYTATDSLFVILFSGSRTGRAIRIDLPQDESAEQVDPLLDFICDILHELDVTSESAPAIAITCSRTFAECGGPPWSALARRIERRLIDEEIGLRELCCLAPDGWIGFLDPAAPRAGRPLSEIAESPIRLDAQLRGEVPRDLAEFGVVPEAEQDRCEEVREALDEIPPFAPARVPSTFRLKSPKLRKSSALGRRDFETIMAEQARHPAPPEAYSWMLDTAEVTEALRSTAQAEKLSPDMSARLIRCAQLPDRWLLLALGILTRPLFPVELAEEIGPSQFIDIPIDLDSGPEAALAPGWSVWRVLATVCPDFTERDRLGPLRDRLLEVLAETPRPLKPALFALSAWLWWLSGSQSVALRQLDEALEIEPGNELALMARHLVSDLRSIHPALLASAA